MDSGRVRFSPADVEFMQGMIHHHAQAILMSGWAASHDASPAIREPSSFSASCAHSSNHARWPTIQRTLFDAACGRQSASA